MLPWFGASCRGTLTPPLISPPLHLSIRSLRGRRAKRGGEGVASDDGRSEAPNPERVRRGYEGPYSHILDLEVKE